ncbi:MULTISPECIES: lysozyme [unclassified Achromobacter]|uniref:lysozyme n=1 Tax=unclassified Achromobacter TaxID=2626865 RepID=UPI000B519AB2|nr:MULTISPECIES: lysozyme [unclassified Achromobacter]OWT68099.1 hypothetical protein CEY05_29130 [Achromobacter sp. HZ34]OWT69936.1 hypothetical protein CEY04_27960 [Achromobacter sp. HZ28]
MASKLSNAVKAAVAVGASAGVILGLFLHDAEGTRLKAYQDGAKVWTICQGHTAGVKAGDVATPQQCADFFNTDVGIAFAAVDRLVTVPMSAPQRAGVTSFCGYSIGSGACARSTFLKKLNAGDRAGACNAIMDWTYITVDKRKFDCRTPGNKLCAGLVDRREGERELCLLD